MEKVLFCFICRGSRLYQMLHCFYYQKILAATCCSLLLNPLWRELELVPADSFRFVADRHSALNKNTATIVVFLKSIGVLVNNY